MNKNNLDDYIIDFNLAYIQGTDILKQYQFFPIKEYDIYILVAITSNRYKNNIEQIYNKPIKYIDITQKIFDFEITHLYNKYTITQLCDKSIQIQQHNQNDNPFISQFCIKLFEFAIFTKASDIHIETLKDSLIIRFRIDGILIQFFNLPYNIYPILSSILKLLASLDISQKRLPQNGRFSQNIDDNIYDFRISTLPTINGESIVLRVLDNKKAFLKLKDIGFSDDIYNSILKNITATQGMILITGPTGSGKTTTLYSILNQLNNKNLKIISIEDPIEYNIDGIQQVNINNDIGLDYEMVLKNLLRQDPDIMLIGEIRDSKTLQIAIQASLTGHLVIATLHTNNAIKTINRLIDLKAEPFLISSVLKLIVSQRLIRVLCNNCKKPIEIDGLKVYKAVGCKKCNLSGYTGRMIVTESLEIDEDISNIINNNTNIQQILHNQSYKTINDNSYEKVLQGLTSLEEYYRHEI